MVTEQEVKLLKVLQRAKKEASLDIVINLLAAHSVPEGYTADEATEMIVKEMIPKVVEMKKKGELDVELIDISRIPACFVSLMKRLLREEHLRGGADGAHHGGGKEARFGHQLPRR